VSLSTHDIGLEALDALGDVDSLCLFVAEDERPLKGVSGYVDWRMCGSLSRILMENFFRGSPGESLLLPTGGRLPMRRIFVVGIGPRRKLDAAGLEKVLDQARDILVRAQVPSVALELPGEGILDEASRARVFRSSFLPAFSRARVALFGSREVARSIQAG
jgi:hypothetical protein